MLIECLQENVDLFSISPLEMNEIDFGVDFHQLNLYVSSGYLSQRQRKQSP